VRTENSQRPSLPHGEIDSGLAITSFNENLMLLSRRFFQICLSTDAKVAEQQELNATQLGVLACLCDEPDLDQNTLTRRLGVDRSSTSTLIDELMKKGFVQRRICHLDRRQKRVRLTDKGLAIHDCLRAKADAGRLAILSSLPPEDRKRFLDLLLAVIEANEVRPRSKHGECCDQPRVALGRRTLRTVPDR
jgi:DNA-binding MarR family transcriptional regulator